MRRAVVVALLLAGCGGGDTDAVVDAPAEPWSNCTVGDVDHAVRITVDGPGADAACDGLVQELSGPSSYWRRTEAPPEPGSSSGRELTCVVTNGVVTISISDVASGYMARDFCGRYVGAGWTDVTS